MGERLFPVVLRLSIARMQAGRAGSAQAEPRFFVYAVRVAFARERMCFYMLDGLAPGRQAFVNSSVWRGVYATKRKCGVSTMGKERSQSSPDDMRDAPLIQRR